MGLIVGNIPPGESACFKCGQDGHWARECPNQNQRGKKKMNILSIQIWHLAVMCFYSVERHDMYGNQLSNFSRPCPGWF